MSDDTGTSGADDQSAGGDDQSKVKPGGQDQVSYETYKKTIAEVKKLKDTLRAQSDALAQAEQAKLMAEGNKDELINKLKTDLQKLEKTHKETFNSFVYSSLDAQVREEAAKLGCIDPDALVKLADLSQVEVDAKTFKADKTQLSEILESLKKEKTYLFNRSGPKINTQGPGGKIVEKEAKPLKDMTKDELWAELRKAKE
jgi:hypothetical protein